MNDLFHFSRYSLRTKLALLFSVLLIFSIAMVSYFSYWNIWNILINNKINHLKARSKPIIEHWLKEHGLTDPNAVPLQRIPQKVSTLAHDLTSRDAVAVVLSTDGAIIANGKRLPEEPVAPTPSRQHLLKALSGINEIYYLSWEKGKRLLVFLIPIRPQPGSQNIFGVIQISTSIADINAILFRHGSQQIITVAIILILGIAFGYWLIGISLKELQNLSVACQEIAKGNFAKRAKKTNRKDEISRLADSFNMMSEKLEKLFDSQKRFAANATHELLTPLTGLQGSLEVLLRGTQDDPETVNRLSKGMYKEVKHLIRLCDHLLGLSRLENTANINRERIELSTFVEEFGRKVNQLEQSQIITIQKGPYLTCMADPDLLEQILFNLFSNAVRHSPSGTPIILGWKLIPDYVEIWIADRGEGMDSETLHHAFEPFYRGRNNQFSDAKGSGLGLALTKAMIEAHGGTISIESIPGQGTTVFFSLPL